MQVRGSRSFKGFVLHLERWNPEVGVFKRVQHLRKCGESTRSFAASLESRGVQEDLGLLWRLHGHG